MDKKILIAIAVALIAVVAVVLILVLNPFKPQLEIIEFTISAENEENPYHNYCSVECSEGYIGYFNFEVKEGEEWKITIELTEIPENRHVMICSYRGHWDKGENNIWFREIQIPPSPYFDPDINPENWLDCYYLGPAHLNLNMTHTQTFDTASDYTVFLGIQQGLTTYHITIQQTS